MDAFEWITTLGKIILALVVMIHVVPIMVWVERRGSALMQNRLGPNRIGPLGLLQSLADGLKFIFKEDRAPAHVDRFYYTLAPLVSVVPAFMSYAVIPFASSITLANGKTVQFQIANLDVGFLYTIAVASLGIYGIIMAGWASNNKYSLLGSLRSSAQMISYELSMGLAIVAIVMVFSTVNLSEMAQLQGDLLFKLGPISIPKWGIFVQPLGFLIFLTTTFAETNRLPFDLPEGESEIVAGYHLEYGSMKFALFFMAEYMNMATASALVVTFFIGGWQLLPGFSFLLQWSGLTGDAHEWLRIGLEAASFAAKVIFFLWFFVWVRWTIPRFRYDQLMNFGWKFLLPLSIANVLITGTVIYLGQH